MPFAEKLKDLRLRSGKSLQDLADQVGASKAHIWDLERGHSKNPSIDLVGKLAKAFKVSISELIGENPESEDENPQAVAMYRELRELNQNDLDAIQGMIDALSRRRTDGGNSA